ncbi:MAG: 3-deoxy-8-phosphooctulonate synthase [Gammaproteobacteria bacterium]
MKEVKVSDLVFNNEKPFSLICGLNVLESEEIISKVVEESILVTNKLSIPFVFKASYDKANRSSRDSYRGPGVKEGLKKLKDIKESYSIPIISDVHSVEEVEAASEVLDIIQIPAFLCRQTDLVKACSETGLPINVKKAQFLSPPDMKNIIDKIKSYDNEKILLCERGTLFGYNNLIVDMLGLAELKDYKYPVIFDVTHSLQMPGGLGKSTAGRGHHVLNLAKSAMSLGLAGLFLEVHPNPEEALCDGPCALPLDRLEEFLTQLKSLDDLIKNLPTLNLS